MKLFTEPSSPIISNHYTGKGEDARGRRKGVQIAIMDGFAVQEGRVNLAKSLALYLPAQTGATPAWREGERVYSAQAYQTRDGKPWGPIGVWVHFRTEALRRAYVKKRQEKADK